MAIKMEVQYLEHINNLVEIAQAASKRFTIAPPTQDEARAFQQKLQQIVTDLGQHLQNTPDLASQSERYEHKSNQVKPVNGPEKIMTINGELFAQFLKLLERLEIPPLITKTEILSMLLGKNPLRAFNLWLAALPDALARTSQELIQQTYNAIKIEFADAFPFSAEIFLKMYCSEKELCDQFLKGQFVLPQSAKVVSDKQASNLQWLEKLIKESKKVPEIRHTKALDGLKGCFPDLLGIEVHIKGNDRLEKLQQHFPIFDRLFKIEMLHSQQGVLSSTFNTGFKALHTKWSVIETFLKQNKAQALSLFENCHLDPLAVTALDADFLIRPASTLKKIFQNLPLNSTFHRSAQIDDVDIGIYRINFGSKTLYSGVGVKNHAKAGAAYLTLRRLQLARDLLSEDEKMTLHQKYQKEAKK